MGEHAESKLLLLTDRPHPKFLVSYGGDDAAHGTEEVAGETFVGVKGYKAKGKRLTTLAVEKVEEVETPTTTRPRTRRQRPSRRRTAAPPRTTPTSTPTLGRASSR